METRERAAPFSGRAAAENALVFVLTIMPSSEPEDETRPAPGEPAAPSAHPGEPAEPHWPPAEARPEEPANAEASAAATDELLTKVEPKVEPSPAAQPEQPAAKLELPAAAATPATPGAEPASEPNQEMGLSESTLHWLVDGEQPVEPIANDPATQP